MPATGQGLFAQRTVLAGTAVAFDFTTRFPVAAQVVVINRDANNTYTITVGPVSISLPPSQGYRIPVQMAGIVVNGTGTVDVIATDAQTPQMDWFSNVGPSVPAALSITTAMLANGILSADAAGRGKMADDYFTNAEFVAGAGGKFAPNCLDTTALLNVMATDGMTTAVLQQAIQDGAFSAADASRALFAASFLGNTAVGRALIQAGFFDAATFLDKVAANAIDYSRLEAVSLSALADDAAAIPAASLATGFVNGTLTAGRAKALDTAVALGALLPGAAVGTWFDCVIAPNGAFDLTLSMGAGMTYRGTAARLIYQAQGRRFRFIVTATGPITMDVIDG